jgi:hypothetical protein
MHISESESGIDPENGVPKLHNIRVASMLNDLFICFHCKKRPPTVGQKVCELNLVPHRRMAGKSQTEP